MALSQKQVDKIVKERTHFKAGLNIETGDVVYLDGKFVKEVDGELVEDTEAKYDPDNILYVAYNEDVDKRIRDFLPRVLNQRGITEPNDIDFSHPHVQAKIKKLRTSPGRNKRTVDEEDQISIIEMVRKAHRPQYLISLMQVILWSMVYDDMFDLSNHNGKGVKLDVKFEFEVPEEYWGIETKSKDDLLEQLVSDVWKIDFKKYDRNNPLEMMLAFATTLLEVYPQINDNISVFQSNIVTAFTFAGGGAQFDDAGFLNSELDGVLRKPNVRRDYTDKREEPKRAVRNNKQDVKPTNGNGSERPEETEQA